MKSAMWAHPATYWLRLRHQQQLAWGKYSVHPGTAVDTGRRQAEAVSGEPAANHAENAIMIREQESRAQSIRTAGQRFVQGLK